MSKEIYISSTPHETRLAIVEDDALAEIYYERENEYTLAGSIYNGKVTRVLPGMQSSFVDIGLERDAFLYITDFMEEAGDSADFEAHTGATEQRSQRPASTSPREGQREPSRRDGRDGRDRNGRGGRSDRNGGEQIRSRSSETADEPTDSELFTAAVASIDPARLIQADRSGNRGRSDGRDRGRNHRRDRNADTSLNPENVLPAASEEYFTPDEPVLHVAPLNAAPIQPSEVGEGSPGADGSRRWRGRRGRRGSRGPVREEAPLASTTAEADSPGSFVDYDRLDIDASAAIPIVPITPQAVSTPAFVRPDRTSSGERSDRGGRERSDRDNRSDRSRTPRVPRGFAPRNLYGAAPAEPEAPVYGQEQFAEAPTTPVILPGESLSKYRPPSEQQVSSVAAPSTVSAPTEFTLSAAWDGGLVLPGETLRRRETSPSSQRAHAPEIPRTSSDPVAELDAHEAQPYLNTTFVPPPPMPEPVEEVPPLQIASVRQDEVESAVLPSEVTVVLVEEPEPEYEPTEASVSFRVDPIPPSEFRQAASAVQEPETTLSDSRENEGGIHPDDSSVSLDDSENPITLAPGFQHGFGPASSSEMHEMVHDVTSISAAGEMHSEFPTEPVINEAHTALDLPETREMHEVEKANTTQPEEREQPFQHFSPGLGFLEEEMLEDEDELPSLQASAVEIDDFEETETLEGAADLGTMIREMSIDQITRPVQSSTVDEENDEEDFFEEDQDFTADDEENDEEELETASVPEIAKSTQEDPQEFEEDLPASTEEAGRSRNQTSSGSPRPEDNSRDHRRNDRSRRSGGFSNNREGSSDRPRRDSRPGGRPSMQVTNLPAISDLLKPGQELLCQIAKEPIARKGARITSHIALPGRFLVFMPTVSHTGVSRKIESDAERRRLKEILLSEKGEAAGGFIVRTAAANASEEELRSDLRFLLNLWADIKTRSEGSKSPALIYHDLNLVERVLRDQVTDTFSAIWVDTETEYERVLRFLQRFQPSLIRRVKLYTKETPLFEQFGITEEINKALRSKVWLKSGGSIVINQTEALVAIDINTGKFVGKTARLEDTIVKTNLDAIPEIVRQIRLRDLGGIIIIDFIDMDDRKNRNKVMAALEEELKHDRAPSKVLQFNDFGLVAITRKRVKQSLERTLSTTCGICAGTGMVKSPVSVCNDIYIEMRKMHKHLERGEVMLRVNPDVVKQLKAPGTKWLQEMEEMVGKTILVKSDPALHPEQFDIH